jgi:hypothetical protein
VIARNSAFWAGALGTCNGLIRNCTITDNLASEQSGAVGLCDGLITNCIIWANLPDQFDECVATITYSCVGGGATGIGNISDDPLFVNPDANDYHLWLDSPCITAGDPDFVAHANEVDIDGEQRILHGRVDMGADEFRGNVRPTAAAGPDQSASSIPSLVTLDGGGSSDLDGDDLDYNWSQIAGPEVQLSDANTAAPSFVPLQFGVYTFELTVNDGVYDSIPDTVNIGIGVGHIPVADAGSSRYAADDLVIYGGSGEIPVPVNDHVVLDGTASYDPDGSGPLSYQWRQISGQPLDIVDANTPTPRVTGFVQGNAIQVCEFELVVNNGDHNSLPDTVEVIIVLAPNANKMLLENSAFDPDKPTTVYFPGGGSPWSSGGWDDTEWQRRANVISFKEWYSDEDPEHYPDGDRSYARCADMIVAYLSSMAPDYRYQIQVMGGSAGGRRSPSVAINMNRYQDARYAANRLTFFDCVWYGNIDDLLSQFLASRVDAEPCWVENYVSTTISYFLRGALNVGFDVYDHGQPQGWYRETTNPELTPFNGGIVAGAYWSVFGPGKNLQLAHTPYTYRYMFKWYGPRTSGYMVLHEDCTACSRLPHPVTLARYKDNADPNGLVLSCYESENAVGYQLLMGSDPYRVGDYNVITDTPHPPNSIVTSLPFEHTWWTVRAYDQHGSTIHADPIHIDSLDLVTPVENLTSESRYQHIGDALHFATEGDEIVARPGTYDENVDFQGKNLTLRSVDSEDPAVVAATIIDGGGRGPTVTFSSREDRRCMLRGFTIQGAAVSKDNSAGGNIPSDMGTGGGAIACFDLFRVGPVISDCVVTGNDCAGLYCYRSSPTVINCTFTRNDSNGVELQGRSLAKFMNCAIVGNRRYGVLRGYPTVTNCTIVGNELPAIASYAPKVSNCILWDNAPGDEQDRQIIDLDGSGSVTYSNVQGGWAGQGNIDTDPCFVSWGNWDTNGLWAEGDYHLQCLSPCIDAGDNSVVPADKTDLDGDGNTTEPLPWDLDCNPRIVDGNQDGNSVVDMGAYEFFVPPIGVWMKITPQALNLGSRGNWVKAQCVLPEGFEVEDVDANTATVLEPLSIESEYMNAFLNEDDLVEVEIVFDRGAFCGAGTGESTVEIAVSGFLVRGRQFVGQDTIRITNNNLHCLADLAFYWLEAACGAPDWCEGFDLDRNSVVNLIDFASFDCCGVEVVRE